MLFFPRLYRLESNPNCMVCERNIIASHHPLVSTTGPATSSPIICTRMGQAPIPNSFQPIQVGLSFNWAWRRRPYTLAERDELMILNNLIANLHLNVDEDI